MRWSWGACHNHHINWQCRGFKNRKFETFKNMLPDFSNKNWKKGVPFNQQYIPLSLQQCFRMESSSIWSPLECRYSSHFCPKISDRSAIRRISWENGISAIAERNSCPHHAASTISMVSMDHKLDTLTTAQVRTLYELLDREFLQHYILFFVVNSNGNCELRSVK